MTDAPRRPLVPLGPELRRKLLYAQGLDEDALPLNLTPAERLAAANPGLPAPKEKHMETTGGVKTTEFWLKLLAGIAMAALGYLSTTGLDTLAKALPELGWVGGLLALAAIAAKPAVAWALHKLAETYADNRTELKVAAMTAGPAKG